MSELQLVASIECANFQALSMFQTMLYVSFHGEFVEFIFLTFLNLSTFYVLWCATIFIFIFCKILSNFDLYKEFSMEIMAQIC